MYLSLPSRENELWLEQLCIFTRLKHSYFLHWEWTFSGNCDLIKKNTSFKNRNEDIRELIFFFPLYTTFPFQFSFGSVAQSGLTLCDPHGLQHSRPPCPSPALGVYSNSCPLSQWCHPTVSSSVVPFFCLQSFPASGSFPVSQFFASGG